MTTFAEFQTYYLREIWREGDTSLITDLPRLIKKAEARISRDLRDQGITAFIAATITAEDEFILPADFKEVSALRINGTYAQATSMSNLIAMRSRKQPLCPSVYAILRDRIMLTAKATNDAPVTFQLNYYMGIVPYDTNPTESFYDQHPDFYIAALNIYVYDYLREFEMSQKNDLAYATLFESMERSSHYAKYPSGQLPSLLPNGVM